METSFQVSALQKLSSKTMLGRFTCIVPRGMGTPIGSLFRTILLSDFPAFGLQSLFFSSFEYERPKNFSQTFQDFVESLRQLVFAPYYNPLHQSLRAKQVPDKLLQRTFFYSNKNINLEQISQSISTSKIQEQSLTHCSTQPQQNFYFHSFSPTSSKKIDLSSAYSLNQINSFCKSSVDFYIPDFLTNLTVKNTETITLAKSFHDLHNPFIPIIYYFRSI